MKGYLYLMPALIVILLFTIYPLIRAFIMSFMEDYNMINGTYSSVGFSNYVSIFKDKYFIKALTNTGIYVAFVVPCSIALSLLIAVLLNSKIKFQGFFQTLYFLPYVTSVIAIGIVWRWIFNEHYGLLNQILSWFGIKAIPWLNKKQYALPALIIFSIWKSMAFDILCNCDVRYGYSHSEYMIHQTQGGNPYGALVKAERMLKYNKRQWEKSIEYYIRDTKITKEQIEDLYEKDLEWFMLSEEALELNVIQKIL